MWFGAEIVVMIQAGGEKKAKPVSLSAYAGAVCAALVLGASVGLGVSLVLPGNGGRTAEKAHEPTFFVTEVDASPMERNLSEGVVGNRGGRPAPRLLGPASAQRLGAPNPFLHQPAETLPPVSIADALDLPPEQDVVLLDVGPTTLTPIAVSLVQAEQKRDEARRPRIAIVLDDLGPDEKATRRAIALPRAITLSFLPYGRASHGLAEEALSRGHEIMVHIPMEPEGDADPGPGALYVSQSTDEIARSLAAQLDRFPGAVGFNNHMGSRFTADVRALLPVMREARARGLLFLDSRTSANTLAGRVAEAAGARTVSRDVFLDHAQGADGLLSQLNEIEKTARLTGSAIGIGHPHALTLEVLEVWARGLESKGIDLVSISVMATPEAVADPALLAASGL
ncbi:MAG: hypothetical protein COA62_01075 [Rhodobiaceae bacterium]|nr:MAG: hypothetical protein COA62_01075 [Rhodobiaceae bacterium]